MNNVPLVHIGGGFLTKATGVLLMVIASVAVSCGSGDSPESSASRANEPRSVATPTSGSPSATAALVGRWERVTTCEELVEGLREAGLGATAPAMLAGNGLVSGSPQQLAKRDDVCEGATPRKHSHFFTADGQFGSLDWNGEQVDDGPYELVSDDTVHIGDDEFGADFRFTITDGGATLRLEPVIEPSAKEQALENPLEFSVAGWSVTVAFPGHTWERVDCEGWC